MSNNAKPASGCTVEGLVGKSTLVFTRVSETDRVQFWCEDVRMSIFVTDEGIVACGPDCWKGVMWHKSHIPNAHISDGSPLNALVGSVKEITR